MSSRPRWDSEWGVGDDVDAGRQLSVCRKQRGSSMYVCTRYRYFQALQNPDVLFSWNVTFCRIGLRVSMYMYILYPRYLFSEIALYVLYCVFLVYLLRVMSLAPSSESELTRTRREFEYETSGRLPWRVENPIVPSVQIAFDLFLYTTCTESKLFALPGFISSCIMPILFYNFRILTM